jgi:hypothetical protein
MWLPRQTSAPVAPPPTTTRPTTPTTPTSLAKATKRLKAAGLWPAGDAANVVIASSASSPLPARPSGSRVGDTDDTDDAAGNADGPDAARPGPTFDEWAVLAALEEGVRPTYRALRERLRWSSRRIKRARKGLEAAGLWSADGVTSVVASVVDVADVVDIVAPPSERHGSATPDNDRTDNANNGHAAGKGAQRAGGGRVVVRF